MMKPPGKIKHSAVTMIIWGMVIIAFLLAVLLSATQVWTSHTHKDRIVAGPLIEAPISVTSLQRNKTTSSSAVVVEAASPSLPYPESLQMLSPTPPKSKRPKLLLGIVSHGFQYKRNKQRRRVIRHTYLKYAETLSGTKICRTDEVLANPEILEGCDVVYAFILVEALHSQYASKEVQADFRKYEPDSIYLPPKIQDDAVVLSEWIKWCHNYFGTAEHPFLLDKMHYVGLISTQVNIYPTSFWKSNELFKKYFPSTFAGIPVDGKNNKYEDDFLCFSRDLVGYLKEAPPVLNKPKEREEENVAVEPLARRVSKYLKKKVKADDGRKINRMGVKGLPFCGAMAFPSLEYWDQYMERVFKYEDKSEESLIRTVYNHTVIPTFDGKPRFLMGIFTTNTSDLEEERRKVVRETYLQSYKTSETPHRICSLQQLLKKEVKQSDCQVAYTFVMGANETAPYTLPMTTTLEAMTVTGSEPDAVYLNIKENMEDGKTETYFHFVELLSKLLYFDYVGKMDTDTLLYTDTFFEETKNWPTFPDNARVYAGQLAIKGDGIIPIGPLPLNGINYMYGRIYMMSPDLARFVSSNECDRKRWGTQSEDISMGNYVHSHPLPIHLKRLSKFCIVHPIKEPAAFRATWEKEDQEEEAVDLVGY
ncbi:MAG: hypothetical protein SGBAC_011943 [Bacillariaceae sp.]